MGRGTLARQQVRGLQTATWGRQGRGAAAAKPSETGPPETRPARPRRGASVRGPCGVARGGGLGASGTAAPYH